MINEFCRVGLVFLYLSLFFFLEASPFFPPPITFDWMSAHAHVLIYTISSIYLFVVLYCISYVDLAEVCCCSLCSYFAIIHLMN